MNQLGRILIVFIICGIVCTVAAAALTLAFVYSPASTTETTAVFEVRPGDSFKAVAVRLQEAKLIASSWKFILYARITGQEKKVRVGEYAIRRDSRPPDVMAVISSGRSIEYTVTVPEGYNKFEIATVVGESHIATPDEFLKDVDDPKFAEELLNDKVPSLEGYLFPETYHVTKFTGARGLIKMMVDRFKENFAKVEVDPGVQLSRHELVTLASIIEKETGAAEERKLISSVFHNRLLKKMRLQTDPTVIYGIWARSGSWNGNISKEDLLTPSKYNTYTMEGLPFGPIANPGLAALQAAASPAQTDYFFFVSKNEGTHSFSKDYSQHQKAVQKYQIDRHAREGKSWRDLKKVRASKNNSLPSAPPAKQ